MIKQDKKGFLIIFSWSYLVFLIFVFGAVYFYFYLDDQGYIENSSIAYDVGKNLGFQAQDTTLIEQEILRSVNQERQAYSLTPLAWDIQLSIIAREHSKDMSVRGFYEHDNPDGNGPNERARNAGIRIDNGMWEGLGENIAIVYLGNDADCPTYDENELGRCLVSKWMSSPGHRLNILDTTSDDIGIGVYCDSRKCYATQDFR